MLLDLEQEVTPTDSIARSSHTAIRLWNDALNESVRAATPQAFSLYIDLNFLNT